jgi:hypothetical protein
MPYNKSRITMRTTKLWFLTVSLGLTASCLVWGGRGIGAPETTVGSEALAALPAELDDTEPFVSQKGRFRFPFPAKPQEMDQKIETATGPLVIHSALHEAADGTVYAVSYFDIGVAPDKLPDSSTVLEGGLQGMVKEGKWTVSSKKAIKIGENPGLDVTGDVRTPGGGIALGRSRMYLVGTRIYQVVLVGAKSNSRMKEFDKYLDSFELLREAPAVARANPARPARGAAAAAKERRARRQMARGASPPSNAVTTRTAPSNAEASEAAATDADPGPDPSQPAEVAIALKSTSTRLVDLPKDAERRQPRGREPFRATAPKGGLLVGVHVGYAGGSRVGSIQPIYQVDRAYVEGDRLGAPVEGEATVVAKPGYAVGAVNTRTGLVLDAFQLVFMKYKDGRLDARDTYTSAWLGNPRGGNLKNVSGGGKIVAGLHGTTSQREVNSLGLVVAE